MPVRKRDSSGTGRAWRALFSIVLSAALPLAAAGEFTLSPYLDYHYSSNIFWDVNQVGDAAFSPGLGIEFSTNSWNVFLAADGRFYRENDFLNSSLVTGGFNLFKVFSARTSLFISPEFSIASYRDDLSFLDTAAPGLTLGVKHALSNRIFSRLGLGARYSDYLNEDSYDRLRLSAFLELSAFFPTQTTLRLTTGIHYLLFPHIRVPSTSSTWNPSLPATASAADDRPVTPPAREPAPAASAIDLAIPQPYLALRAAQGLGFKTGIVAELLYRRNLDPLQGLQSIAASEWALEQTDEDFFWEGTRLSLGLKTEAVLGLEITLDFSHFQKEYRGIEALDLDGIPVKPLVFRSDTLTQAALRVSRRIGGLGLFVSGSLRRNDSNDLYFRYDSYTISAGAELSI
jgi:hypothetical protein